MPKPAESTPTPQGHPGDATAPPHFRALDPSEMWDILRRNAVARLAYTFHDHVDIVPLHYIYDSGWLYGRTSPGEKLVTLAHHRWVAAEVDEIQGPFEWRSVVIHGAFTVLTPRDAAYATALALIRRTVPDALTPNDPTPFRTVLWRIAIQESTGREALPPAAKG